MPLTFIDIEKRKSWRISILFITLVILYFLITIALFQGYFLFTVLFSKAPYSWFGESPWNLFFIVVFALMIAAIHFLVSGYGAVRFVINNLGALPPDPEDGIHNRLVNIMQEIAVASGKQRTIKCLVIPTLSMNALAVTDLKGEAVIAITEGLLSRLTRPQLEAVLAHETYHILSGDCLETTVATSLFGMYASAIEKISDEEFFGIHPAFFLFWMLMQLSYLLSFFISREREYRADAASLRMTRNPLAMAESLYIISHNWTGSGIISSGLEMLCLVSPKIRPYDELEGWLSNLFSTHPPMKKRINILLRMARSDLTALQKKIEISKTSPPETARASQEFFYALDTRGQWQGPYSLQSLAVLPWLSPRIWIASSGIQSIVRASECPQVKSIIADQSGKIKETAKDLSCPSCNHPLFSRPYEKTTILQCRFCGGVLVENRKIPRIIARREKPCTDRVKSLAKAVIHDNQRMIAVKKLLRREKRAIPGLNCTKCGNPMHRTFYSLAYLIEIDRCSVCKFSWFDLDELEMLQCLIENRIVPKIVL
jgi:heat shock protein HtpX